MDCIYKSSTTKSPVTSPSPSPSMALHIDSFTFHVAGADLKSTAKRYTSRFGSRGGLTLLFTHCVGSHKEQWEPTIEQIFHLQQRKDQRDRIREAWAFDWQSHGDAAVINARALDSRRDAVSPVEWALALETFIKSHLRGHRIVALGHSAGTSAMLVYLVLQCQQAQVTSAP
ncbi:hypothetical protein C0993_008298 [Termitomyces sp. T159_Od127]|nr:hypothetical protein C0993_008298 [Termitomyces sp. T159_Od127]